VGKRARKGPDEPGKARLVLYLPAPKKLALQRAALDEGARQGRHVSVSVLLETLVDDYLKRRGGR